MIGIVFLGDRQTELREFPDPAPGPRDVILEIKASGMCGTDLHAYRRAPLGTDPSIAGHEPCGVVVELGNQVSDREAKIGARVMVHHYDGCGVCRHCKTGWSQLCDEGRSLHVNNSEKGLVSQVIVRAPAGSPPEEPKGQLTVQYILIFY